MNIQRVPVHRIVPVWHELLRRCRRKAQWALAAMMVAGVATLQAADDVNAANISATGNATVSGTLSVTGNATFSSPVRVTGTVNVPSYLATNTNSGKTWRFTSYDNGHAYISQDGVLDSVRFDHTTGVLNVLHGATFPGGGVWNSDGNVAVGGSLSVSGDIIATGFRYQVSDGTPWWLTGNGNGPAVMLLKNGTAGGAGNRRGSLGWADNNGAKTESLTWDELGRVGVGTSTPGANLHVKAGSSGDSSLLISRGSGADYGAKITAVQDNGDVYFDSIGDHQNPTMHFRMRALGAAVDALDITGSGNVGIGTASPKTTLDVGGAIRATGFTTPSSGSGVEIQNFNNTGKIFAINRDTSAWLPLQIDAGSIALNTNTGGSVGIGPGSALTVAANSGNVGISATAGSSSPSTGALVVAGGAGIGGNLNIGGSLRAADLNVTGNLTAQNGAITGSSASGLTLNGGGSSTNITLLPGGSQGRVDVSMGGTTLSLDNGGVNGGRIASSNGLELTSSGINQSITLTPTGTGEVRVASKLGVTGVAAANGGLVNNQSFTWTQRLPYFPNEAAQQVAYINLPENQYIWGWIEVTLTDTWSYQNTIGRYTKRFAVGHSPGENTTNRDVDEEVIAAYGPVASQWKIGRLEVANGKLRIPIYHLSSAGNSITAQITGMREVYSTNEEYLAAITVTPPATVPNTETRDYAYTMAERWGFGGPASLGRIQLADHTTSAGGVYFGNDANLYRAAASTLKTDGDLVVGGSLNATNLNVTGTLTAPSLTAQNGAISGSSASGLTLNAGAAGRDITLLASAGGKVMVGTNSSQAALDVTGDIVGQDGKHIVSSPWYSTYAAATGYIKLVTPIEEREGNMFTLRITGYRYSGPPDTFTIQASGYAYGGNPVGQGLIQTSCDTQGTDLPVEIGMETRNGKNVVVVRIGTPTTSWYYPHFTYEYRGWQPKNPADFAWVPGETTPVQTGNTNNTVIADSSGPSWFNAGNVGIGTANPQFPLDVAGGVGITGYGAVRPEFAQRLVIGGGGSSPNSGSVSWGDNTGWKLNFGTSVNGSFAPRMTLVDTGNVGIGTMDPQFPLHVAGGVGITGYGGAKPESPNQLVIGGGGSSPNSGSIAWGDNTGWKLNFGTTVNGSYTPRMTLVDSGNVGIGTANPGAKLDVQGPVLLSDAGNKLTLNGKNNTSWTYDIRNDEVDALTIKSQYSSAAPFAIDPTGKVGIGTTTPSDPLSLGTSIGNKIALWSDGTTRYGFGIQDHLLQIYTPDSAGDIAFGTGNSGSFTRLVTFKGDGKVGIGRPDPQAMLHVAGDIKADYSLSAATLAVSGTSNFSSQISFGSSGTLTPSSTATGPLQLVAGTGRSLVLGSNGSGIGGVTLDSGGRLGIGTTTTAPLRAKMEIRAAAGSQALYLTSPDMNHGVLTAAPTDVFAMHEFSSYGSNIYGNRLRYFSSSGQISPVTMYATVGDTTAFQPAFAFIVSKKSGFDQAALAATETAFRVDNWNNSGLLTIMGGGNVGIGSGNAPTAKLDVVGDGKFSTNLAVAGNTTSTSTSSGALTIVGGAGIGENLNVGGTLKVIGSGTNITTISGSTVTVGSGSTGTTIAGGTVTAGGGITGNTVTAAHGMTVTDGGINIQAGNVSLNSGRITGLATATPSTPASDASAANVAYVYSQTPFEWDQSGHKVKLRDGTNDKLGLGTPSPQYKLDVSDAGGIRLDNLGEGNGIMLRRNSTQALKLGVGMSGDPTAFTITDVNSGGSRLAITGTGRVGVGTSSPQAMLHVVAPEPGSPDTVSGAQAIIHAPQNGEDHFILFRNGSLAPGRGAGFASVGFRDNQSGGGYLWFATKANDSGTAGTPAKRMIIDESGRVGVGVTESYFTDAVKDYKFSVAGKVHAQEVVVDMEHWSDYVFADKYRNAPLSEVEQHIKEHKHLPGVPSAKEVAEKGVNLGQMQAVLLAKVEELTLHMIEQEKRIKRLETENAELRGAALR